MAQLDWSLLGPPVDYGKRFLEGMQTGRALMHQSRQDSALEALSKDPTNVEATNALASVNPQMAAQFQERAYQLQERQRADQLRTDVAGSMGADGNVDWGRASAAYAKAGDLSGALTLRTKQEELMRKGLKERREDIINGAKFLEGVTDDAGYQNARGLAAQAGINLDGAPDVFDPNYVGQVREIAKRLEATNEEYTLGPGAIRMRGGQVVAESPYAPTMTADGAVFERPKREEVVSGTGAGSGSPRGIRNNNPGNIRVSDWTKGQPGFQGADPDGFAKFDSPEAGQRAATVLVQNYITRGFDTPAEIVNRWAPPGENSAASIANYTNHVAQSLGIGPNDKVTPAQAALIVKAKTEFENGTWQRSGGGGVRRLTPEKVETPKPRPGYTKVASRAQYDALPRGSNYIAPDGSRRVKP